MLTCPYKDTESFSGKLSIFLFFHEGEGLAENSVSLRARILLREKERQTDRQTGTVQREIMVQFPMCVYCLTAW